MPGALIKRPALLIPALVAIAALSIALTAGPAVGASGGHAVAAKKKCKKKKSKSSAESARKKKCKKKKKKQAAAAPVVRATLTWTNADNPGNTDLDLYAFDTSGNRAGNGSDTIPSSTLSSDVTGGSGTETFTDLAFNQKRRLSFGVCYMVGGSVHTDYTITYVTADGVTHTETRADDGTPSSLGSSAHVNYPGGATIPSDYCPGTNLVP